MLPDRSALLAFLADRRSVECQDEQDWSLLFAEARACGLTARLAAELEAAPPVSMPKAFRAHLLAANRQGKALVDDVRRELHHVGSALASVGTKVVLLKGAAYVAAGLPSARGRVFSDIDVLVERGAIAETEATLMLAGWSARHVTAYDARYYREWSHEIPPMVHLQRGTVIDLHHSLVMPTCRIRIDVQPMLEDVVPIPGEGNWFRLNDEDLVLHAASHLLLNSEFSHGLRDLWDIDILMRHFSAADPDFADSVLQRAERVGLGRVIRQAFTLCREIFATPLPQTLAEDGWRMWLLRTAVGTRHPDTRSRWQPLADVLLLVRELSLRLPTNLLIRHLWHKATMSGRHGPEKAI
jgi:hypothetical protein